ncbi:glucose 1-dehydrogenase [Dictyobacter kobayashii]|uniref:Short-chain dehydrogenase n=1 Tax=Dictyobacter kobayashii TaxID=2014872 RepID=A0A402AKL4_9CHLR|nr:glucose 1-dehydrogenase [Dictyobacter kobayashii]GCE19550.1 short-chain dehydrogenase [Dictyobacter kobayashii]
MNRLEGKVALITGGNSGIGLATAKEFHAQGAMVAITGRDKEALERVRAELGERTLAISADVTRISDIEHAITTTQATFGKLDVLFANAGIARMEPIEQVTEESFDRSMDVNVKGVFFTIQKALPFLNEGASIILNGSVNGHVGYPGVSVYSATKAAIHSLARTLSSELSDRKIRVNAITIGPITTPFFDKLGASSQEIQGFTQQLEQRLLLKRFGNPEEIAKVALFLATMDSSFVVGTELVADGGLLVNTI